MHTGGHVWSSSRQLARWLFARRSAGLEGLRFLELGAGLALPSIVASRLGAEVCATDEMEALLEHTVANADANACTVVSRQLDFTRQAEVLSIGDEAWDVVFAGEADPGRDGLLRWRMLKRPRCLQGDDETNFKRYVQDEIKVQPGVPVLLDKGKMFFA